MTSNAHSDQETGHESGGDKSLLSLSDDVLIMTLKNFTLNERIGIERTSKRFKAVLDRILSLQQIFAVSPRTKKSFLMKSWSPLQSRVMCSKTRLFCQTLSWYWMTPSVSILSRCSSVKLVNLERVDVSGSALASWCPLITHFVTDKLAKASDYVQELVKNKNDVLIESFEYQPLSKEPDADFRFLSNCSRLTTLICPISYSNIPADVLSKVKILTVFSNPGNMDNLIKYCSKNLEQLTIRCGFFQDRVQLITDNFRDLVHLETSIKIKEFNQLIKLGNIQSIKAVSASLNQYNIASFEHFLSANGHKLKYLGIKSCRDNIMNRGMTSLSIFCPNLICFKIENGIKLNGIEMETIKLLPPLGKINLSILGLQEVHKVTELLLHCKNSMRKVSLSKRDVPLPAVNKLPDIRTEQMNETIGILYDHKRTYENSAGNGKSLSWIEVDGEQWNGSEMVNQFSFKVSFYY